MSIELTLDAAAIGFALLIFTLRVINYAISTIRLVFIARSRKVWSSMLAVLEAFIFAVVITSIVSDLTNVVNLVSYCLGAGVGSYLGMWLETRFITSYSSVTSIMNHHSADVASSLRAEGYGVTVTHGEGRDGQVDILVSSTVNRDVPYMISIIRKINPDAFVQVDAKSTIQRGWIPGGPPRR